MKKITCSIVGVSGYSGMELGRLISQHGAFELKLAASDRWAGRPLGKCIPVGGAAAGVVSVSQEEGKARLGEVDLVFLCTPPEVSIDLAPVAVAAGARVVDLSGGFRLAAAEYPAWYGFTHGNPGLLNEAVYSMPEATAGAAGAKNNLRAARLVSNPGCYPTASSLAVLPLLAAGLIEREGIIIDAKSGTTGAGRKVTEELLFSEVDEDFRAYRVLRHQHTPEIDRVLAMAGFENTQVVFTAHLLPVKRGILATAYGRLTAAARAGDANAAVGRVLADFAAGRPFVRIVEPEEVTLRAAVGTNRVVLGARADAKRGVAIVLCAIDNLVKGAAGQAVQNANLMFGLPETAGLE